MLSWLSPRWELSCLWQGALFDFQVWRTTTRRRATCPHPEADTLFLHPEFFVDPSLSFAAGWNQVYSYCVSIPSEIVAAAVLIQYWAEDVNSAIFITVLSLLVILSSVVFVRVFGEMEFVFSLLKIFLVVFIDILCLVITCGGGPKADGPIGFRYWNNPGPFVQ